MLVVNRENEVALRELDRTVRESKRPLVFWIGAGASRWAGYAGWHDVAESVHRDFCRYNAEYEKAEGLALIREARYPDLFEKCSALDRQQYLRALTAALASTGGTPVYERFIASVRAITPLHIVTTNVDDALERNIPQLEVVHRGDVETLQRRIAARTPFVAKLHGTVGDSVSLVFTTSEYQTLINDAGYIAALRNLFYDAHVVFLGYSLADEYVIERLTKSQDVKRLEASITDGVPALVRSLLMRPSVRRMLGVSEAVSVAAIPRWNTYPVLRLAEAVRVGRLTQQLGISSLKLEDCAAHLAGSALGAATGRYWAEQQAQFVLSGRFGTDIERYFDRRPDRLQAIVTFRQTEPALRLRREVADHLATATGGELCAAIDAGLRQMIPPEVLEAARTQLAALSVGSPYGIDRGRVAR